MQGTLMHLHIQIETQSITIYAVIVQNLTLNKYKYNKMLNEYIL